jgi:protein-S-isoprenylcysteine O-methyltransferase Ste14
MLFAVSLLYFLFSYVVTFSEIAPGPWSAAAVAADVGLFALFAVHHSLFARERLRAWVARTVSPALERSVYVWIASLMLIAVCRLWQPLPGVVWQVPAAVAWLLPLVQLAGAWLALRSAAIIDIWDLAGVRQVEGRPEGRPLRDDVDDNGGGRGRPSGRPSTSWGRALEFKTEGPYGWVRHPIYLGWFLLVFGVATMTTTRFVFAVISGVYVLVAIPLEERSIRRAASGRYEEYMQKVPWKLLPRVY